MSLYTPWEKKRKEIKILGEEKLIKENWEQYEKMIYTWLWYWVLR